MILQTTFKKLFEDSFFIFKASNCCANSGLCSCTRSKRLKSVLFLSLVSNELFLVILFIIILVSQAFESFKFKNEDSRMPKLICRFLTAVSKLII